MAILLYVSLQDRHPWTGLSVSRNLSKSMARRGRKSIAWFPQGNLQLLYHARRWWSCLRYEGVCTGRVCPAQDISWGLAYLPRQECLPQPRRILEDLLAGPGGELVRAPAFLHRQIVPADAKEIRALDDRSATNMGAPAQRVLQITKATVLLPPGLRLKKGHLSPMSGSLRLQLQSQWMTVGQRSFLNGQR